VMRRRVRRENVLENRIQAKAPCRGDRGLRGSTSP
jgi:hypothetical protein